MALTMKLSSPASFGCRKRRLPLAASFAAVSFVLTLLLGLILSAAIARTITNRAVAAVEKNTSNAVGLTSRLILATAASSADRALTQKTLTEAATEVFSQDHNTVSIAGVLPNRFVLAGAGHVTVGAVLPDDEAFRVGFRGTSVTRLLRRSALSSATPLEQELLRTYGDLLLYQLPVRVKSGFAVAALVRAYAPMAPVEKQTAADVRNTVGILALGLLIFWLVLSRLVLGASRALTRQSNANAHLATHDALTGLPNRALLRDRSELAINAARTSGDSVALILLDLDGFKEINDTLGHMFGDKLLIEVGARAGNAAAQRGHRRKTRRRRIRRPAGQSRRLRAGDRGREQTRLPPAGGLLDRRSHGERRMFTRGGHHTCRRTGLRCLAAAR